MIKTFLVSAFALMLAANVSYGQDINQSQVPSVVVNKFQQAFSKAYDVEWEMKGDLYKVEFEMGATGYDHSVWYDKSGKMVKHQEEIAKSSLPKAVLSSISTNFKGYRVDGVSKYTENGKVTYKCELDSTLEDWKVTFDENGKVLDKIAD